MNSPAEIAKNYVGIGKGKVETPALKLFILGIMAGIFIGIGAIAYQTATATIGGSLGKLVGACMFPAGLALVLMDPHGGITGGDLAILDQARSAAEKVIVVLTKSDLPGGEAPGLALEGEDCPPVVSLSARTGAGLEQLEQAVAGLFPQGEENWGELLTNARQAEAAGRALEAVASARAALAAGMPADAIFSDVEAALDALGALTGRSVQEDVMDRIFSRFCVGK